MAGIKSLAKDTAIYGISSIVGRFLNWCLVPLYTNVFASDQYGMVTFIYSIVALLYIVLTYGMETGFFRFSNHDKWHDAKEVYSTTLISLATTSIAFTAAVALLLKPLSAATGCVDHPSFVMMMGACVAIDAFTAIPFSYLRQRQQPMRFAILKLVNIGLNIGLNLFFLVLCPMLGDAMRWIYKPEFGIGYIFLSNLIASTVNLLLMRSELTGFRWKFNGKLLSEMLRYSAPLLILGIAGIMNQTIDKVIYPWLVDDPAEAMRGLGIYGANYKIGIVMLMFIQAFRFAYEPFIFQRSKAEGEDRSAAYRDAMKYFCLFSTFIFLAVMFYIDILKYFIAPSYFEGLKVVPIVMAAEVFFGIFFNLSLWYKLTDKTMWGAYFSIFGLCITLTLNILLVPRVGYIGCAWAAFCSYGSMMLASYFIGRRHMAVNYQVGRILCYFALGAVLYYAGFYGLQALPLAVRLTLRTVLLVAFLVVVLRYEPLPLPGRLRKFLGKC
ncbi:MAG: lipopolysaccharide biosynthesis protein [Muribaculaceae bacterium]